MAERKTKLSNSKNTATILAAANALFKEKHYNHISVRDICERAGVSTSSFYSIFSCKDDVIIYMIRSLKEDTETLLVHMTAAANDLERIWILYDRFLSFVEEFGPEFLRAIMFMERGAADIMAMFYQYNDWFAVLIGNCQKNGIIRNTMYAGELIKTVTFTAFGVAYEWSRQDGAFDLREASFTSHEVTYDLPAEYRGLWKNLRK